MGRRGGRLDRAGGGAEHNLIQRPDLLQRVQQFLGMRQAHVLPSLNEGVQPVLVIGDIDRPVAGRVRGIAAGAAVALGIGAMPGIGLGVPAAQPFMRVYPRRCTLSVTGGSLAGGAGLVDMFYHPATPSTNIGRRTNADHGGEVVDVTRAGVVVSQDAGGFGSTILTGLTVPASPGFREFDLTNFVLSSKPRAESGGAGQGLWFVTEDSNINTSIIGVFEWEEESISP